MSGTRTANPLTYKGLIRDPGHPGHPSTSSTFLGGHLVDAIWTPDAQPGTDPDTRARGADLLESELRDLDEIHARTAIVLRPKARRLILA